MLWYTSIDWALLSAPASEEQLQLSEDRCNRKDNREDNRECGHAVLDVSVDASTSVLLHEENDKCSAILMNVGITTTMNKICEIFSPLQCHSNPIFPYSWKVSIIWSLLFYAGCLFANSGESSRNKSETVEEADSKSFCSNFSQVIIGDWVMKWHFE